MNTLLRVVVVALLLPVSLAVARAPEVNPGVWIVELVDPPTVEFGGGAPASVLAQGVRDAARPLAATSPSVTGAARLDVQSKSVRAYAAHLDAERERVLDRAADALGRVLEPKFVYRHLHNGFAVEMNEAEAERLRKVPGVRAVRPDFIQFVETDQGPQWINAPEMWTGTTGAPNPNRGEGMVLGVVDTGINWESAFIDLANSRFPVSNPRDGFFGLCNDATLNIPCSDKLIGVYDFTNEGTNGFDPDGHGTHVATTAVGVPLRFSLDFDGAAGPLPGIDFSTSGVAPRASFISYKACEAPESGEGNFSCPGTATSAALEQAITDGVDVVNFSIGGDPFDPWSTFGNQRVFLNMRTAGIVPVTSAGNSGPNDFTVGSPANVPWIVAVANATHGRFFGTRVQSFSGGATLLAPMVGRAANSTGTGGTRSIVYAGDFGNALCGIGEPELQPSCAGNRGTSNPFPPGTFNGEIVVCDRGTYGRVEKGKNLQLAGAGGMILANTNQAGDESTNSDNHCLPAAHLGASDGDRLRAWLAAGSNHRGEITATTRVVDARQSGLLNASSSRGPSVGAPNLMKPNVTAPGTDILAASTGFDETTLGPSANAADQIGILSGTSMASPHVAGAALLLRRAQPEWGVSEVVSALETTANPLLVRNGDGSEARIVDRGAGGVQVDQAARIGLFLPVSEREFLDANPLIGGDPGALNLPGITSENCADSCTFTRSVKALAAGSWTVSGEGELGIEVQPSAFTLAAGQRAELQITLRPAAAGGFGVWAAGSVVLTPDNAGLAIQRLPAGVLKSAAELPTDPPIIQTDSLRGRSSLLVPSVVALDQFVVRSSPLVVPESFAPTIPADPSNRDPFDNSIGTVTEWVEVGANALLLHAETFASTAPDIDLFVGRDLNGNRRAEEFELVCESTSPDDTERCRIEQPEAGDWWVLVQNWSSSAAGSDRVPFEIALLSDSTDPSLSAEAPGRHAGGPLTIDLAWDKADLPRNTRAFGAIGLASAPGRTADIGVIPLEITRTAPAEALETALFAGRAEAVIVRGGGRQDKLYIDVPASAAALAVTVQGDLARVSLRRRDFDELVASVPATPSAPAAVLAEGVQDGNTWTVGAQAPAGQRIPPGRYYVVLDNGNAGESRVEVTAEVSMNTPVVTQRGLWSPSTRSFDIRQGIDWQQGGDNSFVVWYTFDEAGSPTFYITDAVPMASNSPFFQSTLFRFTSDNAQQTPIAVGEVQLTAIDANRMMFAWRLNGEHGAEMLGPIHGNGCPLVNGQRQQVLGHWFVPGESSGGVTLLATDQAEAWIRYYYDTTGQPRWVISADTGLAPTVPGGKRLSVFDIRGFCANCTAADKPKLVEVGTLERVFINADAAREVLDFVSGPPLNTSVDADREVVRISNSVGCPIE
ncbi:MAG: S8 family serine peptidase [Wenzhouxiangellaceae bacterium]|nr:S8 family serine peptidase [Wenzhouxiangellaceae bacterium]